MNFNIETFGVIGPSLKDGLSRSPAPVGLEEDLLKNIYEK